MVLALTKPEVMKKDRYALLLPALIALVSCSVCPEPKSPSVYIGIQANTDEDVALAKDFLQQAYRESRAGNTFHIDLLQGDTTVRLLSKRSVNEAVILDIANQIDKTQSTDLAITSFFQRVEDFSEYNTEGQDLHAYFIGTGTSDETTLTNINGILKEIGGIDAPKDTHFYLVGVSAENRLTMSDAFNPLREATAFSSRNYSEWGDLVTQYNTDYCSQ